MSIRAQSRMSNKLNYESLLYLYFKMFRWYALYWSFTNDLERRIIEHHEGKSKSSFTHDRRPIELIFHQEFNDVNQAIYFEKKIKKWSAKKKFALVRGDFDMLEILSECRNATHYKYKD